MLERELTVAVELARRAGALVMELYETDVRVAYKQPADPVTLADERSNALIVRGLAEQFPDDGIVAEESPLDTGGWRRSRCWYVDPLDGTKEFLARNGEFSVMIGLAIDGESRLGVVHAPARDLLYAAVVGEGAWLERGGRRTPLRVASRDRAESWVLVVSRSHRSARLDAFVRATGIRTERPSGSVGLKCGLIAEGEADVYVHPSPRSSKWDACAPEAIVKAAGGFFGDVFGSPFRYDEAEMANVRGILACSAAAAPLVRDAARALGVDPT
ncbi:MAG: 3'(2'),5'-bisphosphate nucleotidase CysQ [Myxococcota bacterium]|nr:3'(2'),5'-bisphosphate nucleotidase CysQ [Myxococcota bacterium]MDW8361952.1 3'(2'),5'-bisphosphate nucleotidase CysQ [Myxococcales bacterium]